MEKQAFRDYVVAIANKLGYQVEWPPDDSNRKTAHIFNGDVRLWVGNDTWQAKGRITISGCYPTAEDGRRIRIEEHSITVTETKTPQQIAREIERRLLSVYLPDLERAVKQIQKHEEYIGTRIRNMRELATFAGAKFILPGARDRQQDPVFRFGGDRDYDHLVKPHGKNSVNMELSGLTVQQAKAVIAALGYGQERRAETTQLPLL